MNNPNALTAFFKRFALSPYRIAAVIAVLLLVSGCGSASGTIDSSTPGFFNHYVVFPFSYLIQHIASFLNDSYGLAIIAMTLLVRIVLMPLMLRQHKGQMAMKQKMNIIQPELAKLKEKYKDKTPESQAQLQKETLELYGKHKFNPLAVGCLPMLLQLPILTGLYWAIKMTPELAQHSFLWFQLGAPDHVLPFLAGIIYYVQFRVSQLGVDPVQQKQMAFVGFLSPVMMALFSFSAPAAVPLYWVIGGIFMILQTLLAKRIYPMPSLQAQSPAVEASAK
ncbi:membrane protein insertase YidC [Paenibacillus sp. NEAU-GSW1]|uniref:membrane protein insertase YidC n=1 Tax=Paenibacillus sp. NEAU-GSW1 TaxID=2682486 RepID=UPI0012E11965|nr:membrane protein insertase YidC [Paenibacillus sp. NEAU-GSW1]MUT66566.1 membrane protein insertase YidC [Paenibacillus sp. NEAU-GSW1]